MASQLSNGVKGLMKKNKITVFDGTAKLAGAGKLAVAMNDKTNVDAGLQARHPGRPVPGRGSCRASRPTASWSGAIDEAMVPAEMPKSLLVIGSGAIGIEFASFYRHHGRRSDRLPRVLDRVLPVEDAEVSAFAKRAFEKQGMKILTSATVSNLKKGANSVTATITVGGKAQEITVDRVISAVGIVGNVENLGLEGTKVKVEKTHIVIDQWGCDGRAQRLCARRSSQARPGSPTRRCTRACWWSRRSPA